MFLTLTPSKQHSMEKTPVSLNVEVKPFINDNGSDEGISSITSSLKGDSNHGVVSVIQNENGSPESNSEQPTVPVPDGTLLTDGIPAALVKTQIEDSVLPPGRNSNQDTVATETINATNPALEDLMLPATRLRRHLADTNDLIVCPGVYDGFSARIALAVGFDALYMVKSMIIFPQNRYLHSTDRCWHHSVSSRAAGPWSCTACRYASSGGHDCQSRPLGHSSNC